MLEVDGGLKSGSGTILRLALALAGILGEPLHLYNIRKKRDEPGLKPQHLEAVLTAAKLCSAELRGAFLGSQEIWFEPKSIGGGEVRAEIGTAGSIPMLIMTVLPICFFANSVVSLDISRGGTDVRNSPTTNYLAHVLLPSLERMGLHASIEISKYGYFPRGMGEARLEVQPSKRLSSLKLEEFGEIERIEGISVCTFLADRKVAERQARKAERLLKCQGYNSDISIVNDFSNPSQKGSSIVIWAKTSSGVLLGGDAIGELGKTSESVAEEALGKVLEEVNSRATVDLHMADMLVPYVALAGEESVYLTRMITEHLESNIWLASKILGVDFQVEKKGRLYRVVKK